MSENKFRVIVVGGGPSGLTAAHALSRAGIDYIVLEHRNSITVDVGASLVLWPQGLRILAQLGLLGPLHAIGAGLGRTTTFTLDGHKYKETWATLEMEKNHGMRPTIFQRAQIISVLYNTLSEKDKSCIFMGKRVTEIVTDDDGVEVSCADGSVHRGSIVVGADGAHSMVREIMRKLSVKSSSPNINDEHPYLSEYRALWASFPRQAGSQAGETFDTHGKDVSLQYLVGHDRAWIFIYERLETPTRDRVSYSQEDVEALATRHADLPISEHLKVKDVFPERYKAGMTNLEEGIVKHWSWNRIVLIGDAAHKFTPNQGLGFNNGIQDVAALVNELHAIVPGQTLNTDDLAGAFQRYQASRMDVLLKDSESSAGFTRLSAWRTPTMRILDRYILPSIPKFDVFMVDYMICKVISKAPSLNFVETGEPFQGRVPWQHPATRSYWT